MKTLYIVKDLCPPESKSVPDFYFNELRLRLRPDPSLYFTFEYALKEHIARKTGVYRINDHFYDVMIGKKSLGD